MEARQCRVLKCLKSTYEAKVNEVCTMNGMKAKKLLGNPMRSSAKVQHVTIFDQKVPLGFI